MGLSLLAADDLYTCALIRGETNVWGDKLKGNRPGGTFELEGNDGDIML